jgi:hypothetical protein
MFSLLTLDESTLFYWTLSDNNLNQKRSSAVNRWASAVPQAKSTSQVPRSTSSCAKTDVPSLTIGSSARSAYTSTPSILSNNVKIIVKAEPAPAVSVYNNGGLSDNDEIKGEERDIAIKSPPKGKRRITSEVFFFFLV